MNYQEVVEGIFIERPNRFVAYCEVEGTVYKVHVKNTGRCQELLLPGVTVYVEKSHNPKRKTPYSLIAVKKGSLLINMDSQAPNMVVEEALSSGQIELSGIKKPLSFIKREQVYGQSRFDFYCEAEEEKIFIEVKGVTLEEEGVVRFPDAPTERGIKHLEELIKAQSEGYHSYILFVVQMGEARYFTPHGAKHPEFEETLKKAAKAGVNILAYTCEVTPSELTIKEKLPVQL